MALEFNFETVAPEYDFLKPSKVRLVVTDEANMVVWVGETWIGEEGEKLLLKTAKEELNIEE